MTPWWSRFWQRGQAPAPWDASRITDEWFRAHFEYAADVVHDWMAPHLDLRSARLLNFGCGDGITDLALVLRHGATAIHGIDIRQEYRKLPRIAREQIGLARMPRSLSFETIRPSAALAGRHRADGIFSWSTFEHVQRDQLEPIVRDLFALLRPGGVFFLQIEPLFYSAFGSHLRRYVAEPWRHLTASEAELWAEIAAHQGAIDGAERDFGFDDFGPEGYKRFVFKEYQALNRLTADELVTLLRGVGFGVLREQRRTLDLPVPEALQAQYDPALLRTNEIFLLLHKPA